MLNTVMREMIEGRKERKERRGENAGGRIEKRKSEKEGVERWLLEHDLLRS